MNLPRGITGSQLINALAALGYQRTRQVGSHVRLSTKAGGMHSVTVPLHSPLRVGTLAAILSDVANHHGLTREQLMAALFG